MANQIVRIELDREGTSTGHAQGHTTTVVVGGGAGVVGQGDIRPSIDSADGATKHLDEGVIGSCGRAIAPRRNVGKLQGAIGHSKTPVSVGGGGYQGAQAGFKREIQLCALRDHTANGECVPGRHVDTPTETRVAIVAEHDATGGITSEIEAQGAARVPGAR